MFLTQCYNSKVFLGYPHTCNEAVTYLSTLKNTLQNRPSWKCIFYDLALTRIESKAPLYSKGYTACKQTYWMVALIFCTETSRHVNYNVSNQHWTSSSNLYNESNAQKKFTFKCWSCHASNVVHQLSSFCALFFAIFADEVVLLIFVLQTFSWNHSPIYFVCSPLSSLETFWSICITLCCKRYIARHRT